MTILSPNRPNSKFWKEQANKATEGLVKADDWNALLAWREKALTYVDTWQDIALKSQKRLHDLMVAQSENIS